MVQKLTSDIWDGEVLKSDIPVLVDFYADWCGPCKMMAPVVEKLSEEYTGKVKFGKINVDENQAEAVAYGVQSIPYLAIFKGGEIIATTTGLQQADKLKVFIEQAIK